MSTGVKTAFAICISIALSSIITMTWWASRHVAVQEYESQLAIQASELSDCNSRMIDWCDGRRFRVAHCNDTTYVCFCASDKDFDDAMYDFES